MAAKAKQYLVPKGAKTVKDAQGNTWYATQGGNWRNVNGGALSKTQPGSATTTPGATAPAPTTGQNPSQTDWNTALPGYGTAGSSGYNLFTTGMGPESQYQISDAPSQGQTDVDAQLRMNATQGMSQPVLTAMQEAGQQNIGNQLDSAMRLNALRNAGSGVSGGAQVIGQAPAMQSAMQAQQQLQDANMKSNLDFMTNNLGNWGTYENQLQGQKTVADQYNSGQLSSYNLGALNSGLGAANFSQTADADKLAAKNGTLATKVSAPSIVWGTGSSGSSGTGTVSGQIGPTTNGQTPVTKDASYNSQGTPDTIQPQANTTPASTQQKQQGGALGAWGY